MCPIQMSRLGIYFMKVNLIISCLTSLMIALSNRSVFQILHTKIGSPRFEIQLASERQKHTLAYTHAETIVQS